MTGRRSRNQAGATAILVAALAVTLIGMAAFTADFGLAYTSKRQLQTSTDAAVLAAGAVYAQKPGSCNDLVSGPKKDEYLEDAEDAAKGIVGDNQASAAPSALTVNCVDDKLVVGMSATATTKTTFGALFGASSINTQRSAEATVDVPTSAAGIRPVHDLFPQPSGIVPWHELPGGLLPREEHPVPDSKEPWELVVDRLP